MSSETDLLNKIAKLSNAIQQRKQEQNHNQYSVVNNNNNNVIRPSFVRPIVNHNKSLVNNNKTMTNINSNKSVYNNMTTTVNNRSPLQIQQRPSNYTTFNNKTLVNTTSPYTKPIAMRPLPPTPPGPTTQPVYNSFPNTKSINKSLVLNKPPSTMPMYTTSSTSHNKSITRNKTITSQDSTSVINNKPPLPPSQPVSHLMLSHNKSLVNKSTMPNSGSGQYTIMTHPSSCSFTARKSHNKKIVLRQNKVSSGTTTVQRHVDSNGQIIVTIAGVPYITKGKKLVRQDANNTNISTSVTIPKVLVRKLIKRRDRNKNMVIGRSPILKKSTIKRKNLRSIKGNMILIREPEGYERQGKHGKTLVNKTTASKQRLKIQYCGTFTRYGKCPNVHCRFRHDKNHLAICPVFLLDSKRNCPYGSHCRLSHQPSPFNLPRCIHFQRLHCKQDPCPFSHVRVAPKASLCRAFAIEGYCSKGNTCKQKHILVCPSFTILGKCDKKGCRLPHVNASHNNNERDGMKSKQQWIRPELRLQQQQTEKDNSNKPTYPTFQNKSIVNQKPQFPATATTTHIKNPANMDIDTNNDNTKTVDEKGENGEDLFIALSDNNDSDDYWNQYLITSNDDLEEINSLTFNNEDDQDNSDANEDEDNSDMEEEDSDNDHNDSRNEKLDGNEEVDNMEDDDVKIEDNEDGDEIIYEVIDSDDNDNDDDDGENDSVEEIYEEVSEDDDFKVYI